MSMLKFVFKKKLCEQKRELSFFLSLAKVDFCVCAFLAFHYIFCSSPVQTYYPHQIVYLIKI